MARERLGVRRVLAVAPELECARRHDGRGGAGRAGPRAGRRSRRARARGGGHARGVAAVRGARRRRLTSAPTPPSAIRATSRGSSWSKGQRGLPRTLAAFRRSLLGRWPGGARGGARADGLARASNLPAGRAAGASRRAHRARRSRRADPDRDPRRDRPARAQTLEELRAALAARDERLQMMLAGIAHEVRNPLGGLELYAGLLRDALAAQPERLERSAASSARSLPQDRGERVPGVRAPARAPAEPVPAPASCSTTSAS